MHDSRFWELLILAVALGWAVFDSWRRRWYGNVVGMILAMGVTLGFAAMVLYGKN
jgi:hypothetical protein